LPTELYAAGIYQLEGVMPRVIATFNAGDAASILPTLDAEVALVSSTFNPNPYYFKALAQARTGDFDGAIRTLTEAEERTETDTRAEQRPFARALIQSGFADVELLRAQTLRRAGNPSRANQSYTIAMQRAEDALESDQQNARAHIVIIQAALDQRRFGDALDALEFAFGPQVNSVPFKSNLDLITLQGQVYLARAATPAGQDAYLDYEQADLQGRVAIFANPFDRRGHELRIAVALAQKRAGDAVLLNDTYRLYFQNDPRSLKLLGDARVLEGNQDLAFNAYSDAATAALNTANGGADAADALVARAGLLLAQGEGGAALTDLNAAYEALPDATIRAKRMDAAYVAGEYAVALEDAELLVGSGALPDDVFYLMQARVRYDLAKANSEDALLAEADDVLALLARTNTALPAELRPIAEAYRARAALVTGDLEAASVAANTAFNLSAIPALQILRADVRAAQGRFDEARADYLTALNATADSDEGLALLARAGLEQLPVRATATAVVITATAQAVGTATAEVSQTSAAGTAEAISIATATAQASITPTLTLTPSVTPMPEPTETPTPAPTEG
jgi:tetratricopeptide (TPR) repeat protein